MSNIRDMLLEAPEGQLDACMHEKIRAWDDAPTSLQILEVLDDCIYAALASGFVVTLLQALLDGALKREHRTLDDILPFAFWREAHA